jgi:pimeloyl-ACP methyl ester carboxylesterase
MIMTTMTTIRSPSSTTNTIFTVKNDNMEENDEGSDDATTITTAVTENPSTTTTSTRTTEILNYEYNGFTLTCRKLQLSRNGDSDDSMMNNILLIHPIGVGLASWFWVPFMESLGTASSFFEGSGSSAVYAPNLIGCGCSEGSDIWDPNKKGLFIPLDWARGCEALMDTVAVASATAATGDINDRQKWMVIAQGGLAPIGVLIAHRNPNRVTNLVLTSPPTWKEMMTPVPEKELNRNYNFLTNPLWGNLAFKILESRKIVEFFSNQFLFSKPCDATWLDYAQNEWETCGKAARPPVQMFNAGFCMNRSLEKELTSLEQPTLVVQGQDDKRQRTEYSTFMKNCVLKTIPDCQNVLPWEQPDELVKIITSTFSI